MNLPIHALMHKPNPFLSLASLLAIALALAVGSCAKREDAMMEGLLKEAKQKFAPDRRTQVFDVTAVQSGSALTLRGEIHSAELKSRLLRFLQERGVTTIVDSIVTLPDSSLGERVYALVSVSVANIRIKPEHSAELGTQALLGTPLKLLKHKRDWYYVQTPDDYLGWTDDNIQLMNAEGYEVWAAKPKVIVTATSPWSFRTKDQKGEVVGDLVAGCLLGLDREEGAWYSVTFPDGRRAFVAKTDAEPFDRWLPRAHDTPETIVATAKRFFGVPYFWGGTSAKAMDCSGFTKTVYILNGVLLPRDASQQVYVGDPIDTTNGVDLNPGDLLFFGRSTSGERGERVTHVAISLGGKRFIHASDYVRINSLDPADADFSPARAKTFLRARRIIGAGEESGVRRLSKLPYYRGHEH